MHELGLVNYAVKEVSKIAEEHNVTKITSYLYDYWNWYTKKYPVFEGSELKCEEIPAVTWCDNCKITYSTITYGKTCPHCGSGNTWLLRGNEMRIKQVEVYDEEEEGSGTLEAKGEYIP